MDLPAPQFVRAHAVLGLTNTLPSRGDVDESFIAAVQSEFPSVVSRQPPDTPPNVPRLVLASTSSRLVVSPAQADFEVQFYGDFLEDLERSLAYIERKVDSIRRGFEAVDQVPANIGVISTFQLSFEGLDVDPAEHVLRTHLRTELEPEVLQDAIARIAVKVRDKYFVTLGVSNFESRIFQRPIMPGMQPLVIRPWEGTVEDFGVELVVDINNGLEGRVEQADAQVTADGVSAVLRLLGRVATTAGPQYVETASVRVEDLVEEPA
jgi:hypothetical protein